MVAKGVTEELGEQLNNDDRDVADLWKDAIKSYQSIVGFDLQRKFDNVQSMLDFGTDQMNNFHKFRHDKSKVDRLRTLFSANLDLVEKGANQIIAAASPAFPPAAAIGTALTYMLQACRSVSADYDIVIVFFEDMNSFLSRITILETRLPQHKAYQNCLMDVFTSLLTMCGFAHKYIELGRFKKWISNLFKGDDGELSGARAKMDKNIKHLQQATEFAILGNTEETRAMTSQLDANQRNHAEMLQRVGHTIDTIHENTENIRGDIAKLLKLFGGQKQQEKSQEKPQTNKPPSGNKVRNFMLIVYNDDQEYKSLKETLLPDSCSWIFAQPEWEDWLKLPEAKRPILALTSGPGTGKSHMAAAVYDKLAQRAKQDETGHTCVGHFYFREQEDTYRFFLCGIITVIIQIAESNNIVCEKLSAQISRDDLSIDNKKWQDLVKHLLVAVFGPESNFNLSIVLDGLDELFDWDSFKEFLSDFINDKGLKISLVVTSRPDRLKDIPQGTNLVEVQATKEKQSQDFKALIWSHLNSLNNLRRFSRYIKQRVADNIEEDSPNMLYAQHLLVRFDELGREGAVLRALKDKKPEDLTGIYDILLAECQRRLPDKHQRVAASLLHWVAFSKRRLSLSEVQLLVKHIAQDDEFTIEEMPELFSKFLRVGGGGYDPEVDAKIAASKVTAVQDVKQEEDNNHDRIYDDGPLPITFKERSIRLYFTNSSKNAGKFRWGPSEAHRTMAMACAEFLRTIEDDQNKLKARATSFQDHFNNIEIDQHTHKEQIEALEVCAEVLSNKTGIAKMLSKANAIYNNRALVCATHDKLAKWYKLLEKPEIRQNLSNFSVEWWERVGADPSSCRFGVAKGFLRELYEAPDTSTSIESWKRLRDLLHMSGLENLLMDQAVINFPDECKDKDTYDENIASLGVLNLFGDEIKPDAAAHRAVSEVLHSCDLMGPAETICKRALELCNPGHQEWYKISNGLVGILLQRKKKKEAHEVAIAAVNQLPTNEMPPSLQRTVHTACARAQWELGNSEPALESYSKAKASDPDGITPGEDLSAELTVVERREDKTDYIQKLKNWSLLERITWLASEFIYVAEEKLDMFCDIACERGEQDFIVSFYEEAIEFLDNLDASTPLRLHLARIYFEVCRDPQKAMEILDEIFDIHSTAYRYPILGGTALWLMDSLLDTMANVQQALFRQSRDPAYKAERIASLASLDQRPFIVNIPRTSVSWTSAHRVSLAYMYLVMGPTVKFQETMQSLLKDCFAGLNDSVGWNDAAFLILLAQLLGLMSKALHGDEKLRRYARIVGSAMFSRLSKSDDGEENAVEDKVAVKSESTDKSQEEEKVIAKIDDQTQATDDQDEDGLDKTVNEEEDETPPEDEGDLGLDEDTYYGCGGFCNPEREFRWWGGRSAYLYVTFESGLICEECQNEYDAIELGEKSFKGRYFYGVGLDKIKLPIEGWRGVKDGMIMLEGEESVAVDDFFKKLQNEVLPNAWERLWAGEAF
ncbi:hypothetical protein EDB82DRAFT_459229 [Fusarium venenatum]|uniref:uncharacterized protein n=1 Tax=Fusarium venenatum TaxID=56646 RepID=UPI001D7EF369|nr:hypothetical protein EDB82DRAFT_459229 [Fusarium venenatum]